jgi:hypothetical protein
MTRRRTIRPAASIQAGRCLLEKALEEARGRHSVFNGCAPQRAGIVARPVNLQGREFR